MSDSKKFTMVYDEFLTIGMSWNEAGVIAYTCRASSLSERKGVKVSEIAEYFHFCERLVRATLSKAQRLGIIKIERNEFSIMTKCELQDLTGKVWAEPKQPKTRAERKPREERKRPECSADRPVSDASHVNYEQDAQHRMLGRDDSAQRAIILEVFCRDYAEHFGGQTYRPTYNETTALAELTVKIMQDMTASNICTDDETMKCAFGEWLQNAWRNADKWKKDRWSIDTLNRYYNELQRPKRESSDPILDSYAEEIRRMQQELINEQRDRPQQQRPDPQPYRMKMSDKEIAELEEWYRQVGHR